MYHFKIRHIIRTTSLIGNCRCVDLASDKSRVVVSGIASLSILDRRQASRVLARVSLSMFLSLFGCSLRV